jgi:hypothetical protein
MNRPPGESPERDHYWIADADEDERGSPPGRHSPRPQKIATRGKAGSGIAATK